MVRDMTENNELKTPYNYMVEEDEIYPCANFTGQPEFSVFERERYNVENDEELPSVTFTTNIGPNELAPLPSEHTLNYQEVHWELERCPPRIESSAIIIRGNTGKPGTDGDRPARAADRWRPSDSESAHASSRNNHYTRRAA